MIDIYPDMAVKFHAKGVAEGYLLVTFSGYDWVSGYTIVPGDDSTYACIGDFRRKVPHHHIDAVYQAKKRLRGFDRKELFALVHGYPAEKKPRCVWKS